jgi:hypothetical protein
MPKNHNVQDGDCISSIAKQFGMSWDKIWNDGANTALRQLRKDPNVLFRGDVVVIPDKVPKEDGRAIDQHHVYRTQSELTHVKIRLTIDDKPRKNLPYELEVDGQMTKQDSTNNDGCLEAVIPANAMTGVLRVGNGNPVEKYDLVFGKVYPLDTADGISNRLNELGFYADPMDLKPCVRAFQNMHKMKVDGIVDDAFRTKLKDVYGQ